MVQITGATKLLGVMGYPIEHSLSPVMHNAALQALAT
ncbi:MAG: shikimate dehydrogenase, partial [Acaryochloris sp. SU_5_25]|nr:shikimate dehydrogenase [Acaryochloris sp. SU_5_25]